jgi:hypothetical protein
MYTLFCDCCDFEKYIEIQHGIETLAWIHGVVYPKDFVFWRYCPWCGKLLKKEEMNENTKISK